MPCDVTRPRDRLHITHGTSATDHDRFGALSIDTVGPDNAKTAAPSAVCPRSLTRAVSAPRSSNARTVSGRSW